MSFHVLPQGFFFEALLNWSFTTARLLVSDPKVRYGRTHQFQTFLFTQSVKAADDPPSISDCLTVTDTKSSPMINNNPDSIDKYRLCITSSCLQCEEFNGKERCKAGGFPLSESGGPVGFAVLWLLSIVPPRWQHNVGQTRIPSQQTWINYI